MGLDKVALVIGGTLMLMGGVVLLIAIIGFLIYIAEAVWVVASEKFRDICKAESLIHEYRLNREKYLEWKENKGTATAVVNANQHRTLIGMYNDLREDFVDYVCSGVPNPAPYCQNRCEDCVDCRGWCEQDSDKCNGFNPADFII